MAASVPEISKESGRVQSEVQLVIFVLAGCEIGVPIHQVREIIRASEITVMPKAPKFLEGVINLRGRVVPVLDLRKRFEMPMLDKTPETRILVLELKDQMLGLLVDKVADVLRIPPDLIRQAEEPVLNLGTEFIGGLASLNERLIVVFKTEKVFNFDEWKALPELERPINPGG